MTLAEFLSAEKLSLAEFGQLIAVRNKQTLSRYVRCERFPPPDVLVAIRKATDGKVTADDFANQHVGGVAA